MVPAISKISLILLTVCHCKYENMQTEKKKTLTKHHLLYSALRNWIYQNIHKTGNKRGLFGKSSSKRSVKILTIAAPVL